MSRRILDASSGKVIKVGTTQQRDSTPTKSKQPTTTYASQPITNPHTSASLNNALAVRNMTNVRVSPQGPYDNTHAAPPKQATANTTPPAQQQRQVVPQPQPPEEKKWDFDSPSFDPKEYKDINEIYDKLSKYMKIVIE